MQATSSQLPKKEQKKKENKSSINFFTKKKIRINKELKIKPYINNDTNSPDNIEKIKISPDINIKNLKEKYKIMNIKLDELPKYLNKSKEKENKIKIIDDYKMTFRNSSIVKLKNPVFEAADLRNDNERLKNENEILKEKNENNEILIESLKIQIENLQMIKDFNSENQTYTNENNKEIEKDQEINSYKTTIKELKKELYCILFEHSVLKQEYEKILIEKNEDHKLIASRLKSPIGVDQSYSFNNKNYFLGKNEPKDIVNENDIEIDGEIDDLLRKSNYNLKSIKEEISYLKNEAKKGKSSSKISFNNNFKFKKDSAEKAEKIEKMHKISYPNIMQNNNIIKN